MKTIFEQLGELQKQHLKIAEEIANVEDKEDEMAENETNDILEAEAEAEAEHEEELEENN